MKILYFTDPHIRANSPGSRLDDFPGAIIGKLDWIGRYAYDHGIKTILVGGDWLDRPDVANKMMNVVNGILRRWIVMYGITVYSVFGNHDIYGYNMETFSRTAMSLTESAGLMNRLTDEPIVVEGVSMTGVDSNYTLDKNGATYHYTDVKGDPSHVKVHVLHGFLDKEAWEMVPSTGINDILDTEADVILTGHEHTGFGIVKRNGKIFCNPGALGRITAAVGDVNKVVQVAVLTINSKTDIEIELVRLPKEVARPADEVLDRDKLVKEKEHKAMLQTFTTELSQMNFAESFNVYAALDKIAEEEQLPVSMLDMLRKEITRAEEEIRKDDQE